MSTTTIRETLASHPTFPSLAAVVETLGDLGFSATAVRISTEELADLQGPVLVHLSRNGDPGLVVWGGIAGGRVTYGDPRHGWITEPLDVFTAFWTGIVVTVEGSGREERDFVRRRRAELLAALRTPGILIGILALGVPAVGALWSVPPPYAFAWRLLAMAKMAGIALCALVIWREVAGEHPVWERLCPAGKALDCGLVLDSPGSRLAGVIPLGDLGLWYFAGGLLALLFSTVTDTRQSTFITLAAANAAALPFTAFSVYYQARVLRRWCWICLAVQALIWLECWVLWSGVSPSPMPAAWPEGRHWIPPLTGFTAPLVIWAWVRPLLAPAAAADYWKQQLARLRNAPEVLAAMLAKQPRLRPLDTAVDLHQGGRDARHHLMLVVHPMCLTCADAYEEAESLIAEFAEELRLSVRFACPEEHGDGRAVAEHVLALAAPGEQSRAAEALRSWYRDHLRPLKWSLGGWRHAFPAADACKSSGQESLSAQSAWAGAVGAAHTPAVILDDRLLPPGFDLRAVRSFLRAEPELSS